LPLFDLLGGVCTDLAPKLDVAKDLPHPFEEQAKSTSDVERFEQLDFLFQ